MPRRHLTPAERGEGGKLRSAVQPRPAHDWESTEGQAFARWLRAKVNDGVALTWAAEFADVSPQALRAVFGRLPLTESEGT
jgi:hypothetical protein